MTFRKELASEITKAFGIGKKRSQEIVDFMLYTMETAIIEKDKVNLTNICTIKKIKTKPRRYFNPKKMRFQMSKGKKKLKIFFSKKLIKKVEEF